MLQWGKASPHQMGKEGGQGTQCVPGLGTSRLVGQGTRFGPQMGILVGQGTQGDCSRAPTRLGPVGWYVEAPSIVPKLGSSWTGGCSATSTSLLIPYLPPRSNLQRQLITKIKLFSRQILDLLHDP